MINLLNTKIIVAIPVFIAINIASLSVWYLDISQQSMPLILGIIAGGLADLDNRLTGRLKNIFYTLFAFSISTISIQLTLNNAILFIPLITLLTFIFTMIGVIGERYNTIAFGTLVVALYTTLTYHPETIWYLNPLLILLGALLYSITATIVYLFFPDRPVQDAVIKSFLDLAEYLEIKALFFDPDDIDQLEDKQVALAMQNSQLTNAFNICRTTLFYRIQGQHRPIRTTQMLNYYCIAQDIHERVNSSYFDYHVLVEKLKSTDLIFRIQRLLELQAQACRDLAQSLKQNTHYVYNPRLERAISAIYQSFEHYSRDNIKSSSTQTPIKTLIDNLKSINWQLRHLAEIPTIADSNHKWIKIYDDSNIIGFKNIWLIILDNLNFNSQFFRHAVRLSIVVLLSCAIVEFFQLSRGYWILLTAIFVCQPNYAATKLRLKQRIIGTILGVIVGSLLPYINPTLELQMGLIVATSSLFFFFRKNNYSYSTFFITLQVLISFNIIGFDIHSALYSRIIDTLIGALISWLAVSYLWPDWKFLQLNKVTKQAIHRNAKYLLYIIGQLQFGKYDNLQYRIARRNAHESATILGTTISNMNSNPEKYHSYLQKGFDILKLNYALLSYISALGAYRKNIKQIQQNIDFMAEFYPIAKKVIYSLEHIESLSKTTFDKLQSNIKQSLTLLNNKQEKNINQQETNIPIQQLNMISQILPLIYTHFHDK